MYKDIDEAIKFVKNEANTIKNMDKNSKEFWANSVGTAINMEKYGRYLKRAGEFEQIAEMLEELKAMRNLDKTNFSDGYERGTVDAIDEYRELLKNYFVIPHDLQVIDMYAEELKEKNK